MTLDMPVKIEEIQVVGIDASTTVTLEKYDVEGARYNALVLKQGLRFEAIEEWDSDVKIEDVHDLISSDFSLLFQHASPGTRNRLYVDDPYLTHTVLNLMHHGTSSYSVKIATLSPAVITPLMERMHTILPAPKIATEGRINVRFWWNTTQGPASMRRTIEAPNWKEIAGNYEDATALKLERLMSEFKPSFGGQILIWHGKPGTGKTYALRALCAAWKKWCSVEYIVDPENLFGPNAGYLVQTLVGADGGSVYDLDEDEEDQPKKGWKLLILEDTGELVREDAKEQTGQGLSRLLNVADGFIGQGLKVLVLITTNEVVEKLHPAVKRPGRAASVVEFNPLAPSDKRQWAEKHGVALTALPPSGILAEMYGSVEGFDTQGDIKKELGFRV